MCWDNIDSLVYRFRMCEPLFDNLAGDNTGKTLRRSRFLLNHSQSAIRDIDPADPVILTRCRITESIFSLPSPAIPIFLSRMLNASDMSMQKQVRNRRARRPWRGMEDDDRVEDKTLGENGFGRIHVLSLLKYGKSRGDSQGIRWVAAYEAEWIRHPLTAGDSIIAV